MLDLMWSFPYPWLRGKHTEKSTSDKTRTKTKEGDYLFNDALNTFYLWLSSVEHTIMVKDNPDSERENPLPPHHGLLFPNGGWWGGGGVRGGVGD